MTKKKKVAALSVLPALRAGSFAQVDRAKVRASPMPTIFSALSACSIPPSAFILIGRRRLSRTKLRP